VFKVLAARSLSSRKSTVLKNKRERALVDEIPTLQLNKRDKEYYELKDTISNGLINFVDRHYPGFGKMVDHAELATPLTSEHFTDHSEGAMYGLPATPERYRQKWLKVKTPLKGFYITGTDISALGVVPSMMGGLATASYLNGPFGFFKLVREMRKNNGHKSHS